MVGAREQLNLLDAQAGDGDAGDAASSIGDAVLTALRGVPVSGHTTPQGLVQLLRTIAASIASSEAGGTLGVLCAAGCAAAGAAAASVAGEGSVRGVGLSAARAFVEAVGRVGGAGLGDCTLLDAAIPAFLAAEAGGDAASAAERGAAGSAQLSPKAGRAASCGAGASFGVVDPGAAAVALWLRGLTD